MKFQKKVIKKRKQARISHSAEKLWFFGESGSVNKFPVKEKISKKKVWESIFNDDYTRYAEINSDLPRKSNECTFVVDWQMSDVH